VRHRELKKIYLLLPCVLLLLLSTPEKIATPLRSVVVASLSPFRKMAFIGGDHSSKMQELDRLKIENQRLSQELAIAVQAAQLRPPFQVNGLLPARVIYRNTSSWSSCLWVNVGKADNRRLNMEVVAKDSPVVVGSSLVGVVDYVGTKQSRVRLISDAGIHPCVRVVRGKVANAELLSHLIALQEALDGRKDHRSLIESLGTLKGELMAEQDSLYLAKGELQGTSHPLWRGQNNRLYGIGFNLDFEDEWGPARDLRTGEIMGEISSLGAPLPILCVNDLLVTTGMDGVFPAGLCVARVQEVEKLREGSYFYKLTARPTAGNLNELQTVYILPPLGFEKNGFEKNGLEKRE
jgi:cell shape-determining protein MreC